MSLIENSSTKIPPDQRRDFAIVDITEMIMQLYLWWPKEGTIWDLDCQSPKVQIVRARQIASAVCKLFELHLCILGASQVSRQIRSIQKEANSVRKESQETDQNNGNLFLAIWASSIIEYADSSEVWLHRCLVHIKTRIRVRRNFERG
jgi:hypothetical protein